MKNALRVVVAIKYALALSGIIIGTVGALAHSAYRAASMDAETHLHAIVEVEANLLSALGYNGLIHNFKNYVLRRSENYRIAAMDNHDRVLEALALLETIAPALGNAEIDKVRRAAKVYRGNLDIARDAVARGASPREIDALVKVDETLASQALDEIMTSLRHTLTALEAERTRDLKVFVRGLLMLIVAIMVLLFLLIVETGRLHREQLEEVARGERLPAQ
jgi:hypothetical protein